MSWSRGQVGWAGLPSLLPWDGWEPCRVWAFGVIPELICWPPVWAGGMGDQWFRKLPSPPLPHTALPLKGEGNGRGEEAHLARPPVQLSLGTLPGVPKTMPGMEAGLARVKPGRGRSCARFARSSGLGAAQWPPAPAQSWAPHSVLGICSPTPWQLPAKPFSQRALSYPAGSQPPEARVCMCVYAWMSVPQCLGVYTCGCVYVSM